MIRFKQGHNGSQHIDETMLDATEATYFIDFLEEEVQRHKLAIRQSDYLMRFFSGVPVLVTAYSSSILSHIHDIKMTNQTIYYLRQKYDIPDIGGAK